jgi:hypothetical protein
MTARRVRGGAPLLAWSRMMSGIPLVVQLLLAGGAIASRRMTITVVAGLLAVALVVVAQRVVPFERAWLPFLPLLCIAAAYRLRFERVVAILPVVALGAASLATERPRDVLHPDAARARRLFVVSHRAGGRTLPGTVAALACRRCAPPASSFSFSSSSVPSTG